MVSSFLISYLSLLPFFIFGKHEWHLKVQLPCYNHTVMIYTLLLLSVFNSLLSWVHAKLYSLSHVIEYGWEWQVSLPGWGREKPLCYFLVSFFIWSLMVGDHGSTVLIWLNQQLKWLGLFCHYLEETGQGRFTWIHSELCMSKIHFDCVEPLWHRHLPISHHLLL